MADYPLTPDADADLAAIYEYSILNFGLARARSYVLGLHHAFGLLGEFPRLGRDFSRVKPNCRRHDYASHLIYYRLEDDGVLILRVLHESQDPLRHL